MTTQTNQNVALTILAQLGGQRFKAMTGANNFVSGDKYLTFRIPGTMTKDRINCVRITLDHLDLYKLEFMVIRGIKFRTVRTMDGVYAENLRTLFTDATGLDTHL